MCPPELLAKDLTGQVYVITGGNSGIGMTTAGQLAKQGATVVIGGRRLPHATGVAAELSEGAPGTVEALQLELDDIASINRFATAVAAKFPGGVHALINNAGVMNTPLRAKSRDEGGGKAVARTRDGFEMQLGVNHLGHFALTQALTPTLAAAAPNARVVILSSCFHDDANGKRGHIDFDDLNFETRPYDGWLAYGQSKLANLLHARELTKRLPAGVGVSAVHPGFVRSGLIKHTMGPVTQTVASPFMTRGFGMIEPWEGAQASLVAALGSLEGDRNGAYFAQDASPRGTVGGFPIAPSNPEASDDAVASRLWEESERLIAAAKAAANRATLSKCPEGADAQVWLF